MGHALSTSRWLLFAVLLVVATELAFSRPAVVAHANPSTTLSRYVGGSGADTLTDFYNLGCDRAQQNVVGAVILDFGNLYYSSGSYGAITPAYPYHFKSIATIEQDTEQFAAGFWNCSSGLSSFATVIIGTNNAPYNGEDDVRSAAGAAWSSMATTVENYIESGTSWSSRIVAAGGIDAEPGFGSASEAEQWADGYSQSWTRLFYDYGSADGCPYSVTLQNGHYLTGQTAASGACNNGWSQYSERYLSWGSPAAEAIPEIAVPGQPFSAQGAQWERISRYSQLAYGGSISFAGTLSEYTACQETGCGYTYDTPSQSYDDLWDPLQYYDYGYVAMDPPWQLDISWYS